MFNVHHKLPESFWGYRQPDNLIKVRIYTHKSFHDVFRNDTPIMRLRRLIEIDRTAMNPAVYKALSDTLAQFEWVMEVQVYKAHIFNPDKFIKKCKYSE